MARAFSVPGVMRVIAHASATNERSIRVLEKRGFVHVGAGDEPGTTRHERRRG